MKILHTRLVYTTTIHLLALCHHTKSNMAYVLRKSLKGNHVYSSKNINVYLSKNMKITTFWQKYSDREDFCIYHRTANKLMTLLMERENQCLVSIVTPNRDGDGSLLSVWQECIAKCINLRDALLSTKVTTTDVIASGKTCWWYQDLSETLQNYYHLVSCHSVSYKY